MNKNWLTMIIKRTIHFTLQKQKNASSRVRMRVSYNGKRLDFQTGIVINESNWNKTKQRVSSLDSNNSIASDFNDHLSAMLTKMIEVFRQFELMQHVPTASELRDAFTAPSQKVVVSETSEDSKNANLSPSKPKQNSDKKKGFWESYDEFVKVNGKLNDWTDATYEKFAALRNHLFKFNPKLTFAKFTEEGIADFVEFLGKECKLKNSTINKQLGFLRWFLRWAYEKQYNTNHTFEYFKPKLKSATKRVIFLNHEELKTIENFEVPKDRIALNVIRDVFLFTCYTGLRYSDVEKLTWDDVHDGKIEVVTTKTTDRLIIEFNKKSKAILDKYSNVHLPGNKVLPVISNQKMNKQLHALFKLAGIDEPIKETHYEGHKRVDVVKPKYECIGTHTGRRTFICTALAKGIPPSVVMKWTGHSDYKAMKPYIDIADEVKSEYMKKFDEDEGKDKSKDKDEK